VSAQFDAKLTVSRQGAGSGTVTSNPPGISCGSTCQAGFTSDTFVELTATPDAASVFVG
jgi:Divergent InlB B-repeat domain